MSAEIRDTGALSKTLNESVICICSQKLQSVLRTIPPACVIAFAEKKSGQSSRLDSDFENKEAPRSVTI